MNYIIVLLVIAGILFCGGLCTNYVIDVAFGKDLPFIADIGIGMVTCGIIFPVALICCIVEACDVGTPFFVNPNPVTQPTTIPAVWDQPA